MNGENTKVYSGPPLEDFEGYLSPPPDALFLAYVPVFFRRLGHWIVTFGSEWMTDSKLLDHLYNYVTSTKAVKDQRISKIHATFLTILPDTEKSLASTNHKLQRIAQAILPTPPTSPKTTNAFTPAVLAPLPTFGLPSRPAPSYVNLLQLAGRLTPPPPGQTSPKSVEALIAFFSQSIMNLLGKDPELLASPFPIELWGVANQVKPESYKTQIPYVSPDDICKNKSKDIHTDSVTVDMQCIQAVLRKIADYKIKLNIFRTSSLDKIRSRKISEEKVAKITGELTLAIDNVIIGYTQLQQKIEAAPAGNVWSIEVYRKLTQDYNKPFQALLRCLNSIEYQLGIHAIFRSHVQNTIILMTQKDPNWNQLAPQSERLPEPTSDLLAQNIEVCRNYYTDRNPLVRFSNGGAECGTEEDWFNKLIQILYPNYSPEKWPLDGSIKIADINWEPPTNDLQSSLEGSIPSLKKFGAGAYVLGFSYTYQGHVVSYILGNPNEGFVCFNNKNDERESFTACVLKQSLIDTKQPYQEGLQVSKPQHSPKVARASLDPSIPNFAGIIPEGGVDYEGYAIALKFPPISTSTPMIQFPDPSKWVIPKWENNNCFLATAFIRLAAFQFYYLQPSIQELIK